MNNNDKKVRNVGFLVLLLMIITSILFQGSGSSGGEDPGPKTIDPFKDVPLLSGSISDGVELSVGESYTVTIAEEGRVIRNMSIGISWQDESSPPGFAPFHKNEPDSFSITITSPYGETDGDSGSNGQGSAGTLEAAVNLNKTYLSSFMEEGPAGSGNWTVEVTLVSAGDWVPQYLPGVIDFRNKDDPGNSFSLSVEYEYYDMNPREEE
ncbi:MAG: hypothetical protein U9R75_08635 [Candidatus Thermoplasmatota archaeon]|nr:hypothetical protein [Candidatus Thermoplasmatota archaeon]